MNRTRNVLLLGGVILVAAAIAGVAQPEFGRSATPSGTTIVVTGSGTVKSVPNRATFDFGVRTQAGSAADALSQNAAQAHRIIAALEQSGIAAADIQTTEVSLNPRTTDHGRRIAGYTASNSVEVTASVGKSGQVVDAAVRAGANNVYGPNLAISDQTTLYDQALKQAVTDAKGKAEAIAAGAGLTLGSVIKVTSGGGNPVYYGEAALAAPLRVPIQAGTQQIQASVTVTYSAGG